MSPILALILCTGFVLWLLRFDRRQSEGLSNALWIPTLWLFAVTAKPLGRWFSGGGTSTAAFGGGSPYDRLFLSVLLLLGLVVLFRRGINLGSELRRNASVVLLLAWMFLSIFWTDDILISLKRWVREATALVMALVVLSEDNPREAIKAILRRMSYILIPYSLLLIKYYQPLGVEFHNWSGKRMWVGVTLQKNNLGRLCIVVIFFLIWTLVRRRQGMERAVSKLQNYADVFVVLLALLLLKGPGLQAYSASSVASLAVALGFFVWLKRQVSRTNGVSLPGMQVVLFGLVILGVVTPLLGGTTLSAFTSYLGRDATFTGRTDIWAGALQYLEPMAGSGFSSFWTDSIRSELQVGEAHNGYLEVLLNMGIIGLLLVWAFVMACGKQACLVIRRDGDFGILFFCILVISVLHNIAETSINSFASQLTATVLFLKVASNSLLDGEEYPSEAVYDGRAGTHSG